MEIFKYHVFGCTQSKMEGAPQCPALGAEHTLQALREQAGKAGLGGDVLITNCGCLGLCEKGPNLVVYPEGVWYSGVKPEDAREIVEQHFKSGRPVARLMRTDAAAIKKEIQDHFAKVKAMKEFMDKAGMFPEEMAGIIRGFMESRIALTAIELDIFTAVGQGADADQVAKKISADRRATEDVLNALAAMKVLAKKEGVFSNTLLTARFLVAGSPDDSRSAMMHSVHLWPRWGTLTEAVKKGHPAADVDPARRTGDSTIAFIAAMHKNASFRAGQVVPAVDLAGVKTLLDLGGGSGAYSIAFAQKKPEMKITVFDLPMVVSLTEKYIAEAGLGGKISTRAGDMRKDELGKDYDLVWVSAICHMFGPEENLGLFRRVHAALAPSGRIVIQDFVMNEDKTSPRQGAVFAINMLVNTMFGGTFSGKEYIDWLTKAGFADAKVVPLPGPNALIIAKKKG
jgi:(2Fe-2S) ferredoxin/2-polyprenyl-3-methyl-5-hydroxy-6-metoxy-1,4-benzoquinol methylase